VTGLATVEVLVVGCGILEELAVALFVWRDRRRRQRL